MIWLVLSLCFAVIGFACLALLWVRVGDGSRAEYAGLVIACVFLGAQTFNAFLHAR